MAKLILGDKLLIVRPFMLDTLTLAAPFLDQVTTGVRARQEEAKAATAAGARPHVMRMTETMAEARKIASIFAVGIDPADLDLTEADILDARKHEAEDPRVAKIMALATWADCNSTFWATLLDVQREAGMIAPGEAMPPAGGESADDGHAVA